MADALCPEGKRLPDTFRPSGLPGMDRHRDLLRAGLFKQSGVIGCRKQRLRAGQINGAHNPAGQMLPDEPQRFLIGGHIAASAHTAQDQPAAKSGIRFHRAARPGDSRAHGVVLRHAIAC